MGLIEIGGGEEKQTRQVRDRAKIQDRGAQREVAHQAEREALECSKKGRQRQKKRHRKEARQEKRKSQRQEGYKDCETQM